MRRDRKNMPDPERELEQKRAVRRAKDAARKVAEAAADAGQKAREAGDSAEKVLEARLDDWKLNTLKPVYYKDIHPYDSDSALAPTILPPDIPALIRIVDPNDSPKRRSLYPASVGYSCLVKGENVLNVYRDTAKQIGIFFSPVISKTVYYENPYKKGHYISLDEYFSFFKKELVAELEQIAIDLGAKKIRIVYKEQVRIAAEKKDHVHAKLPLKKHGRADHRHAQNESFKVEIMKDTVLSGQDEPRIPELTYFRYDKDIANLIKTQTAKNGQRVTSTHYTFKCSRFTGMTERVAVQLDAVLKRMRVSMSSSLVSKVQQENNAELEYYIEF